MGLLDVGFVSSLRFCVCVVLLASFVCFCACLVVWFVSCSVFACSVLVVSFVSFFCDC